MKTFALVENNLVTNVSIANNDWQKENWIDCKNQNVGIGYTYDLVADHFFAPQPYSSWTLDADAKWQPPTAMPVEEGKFFTWDEPTLSWVEVELPA